MKTYKNINCEDCGSLIVRLLNPTSTNGSKSPVRCHTCATNRQQARVLQIRE